MLSSLTEVAVEGESEAMSMVQQSRIEEGTESLKGP